MAGFCSFRIIIKKLFRRPDEKNLRDPWGMIAGRGGGVKEIISFYAAATTLSRNGRNTGL
jgi:hypothetical protein